MSDGFIQGAKRGRVDMERRNGALDVPPLKTLDDFLQHDLGFDVVDRIAEGLLHVRGKLVDERLELLAERCH